MNAVTGRGSSSSVLERENVLHNTEMWVRPVDSHHQHHEGASVGQGGGPYQGGEEEGSEEEGAISCQGRLLRATGHLGH